MSEICQMSMDRVNKATGTCNESHTHTKVRWHTLTYTLPNIVFIVYNRDPTQQYGGGNAVEDSILQSIQEWTHGATTYIKNITNSLDNTLGPDLKVNMSKNSH